MKGVVAGKSEIDKSFKMFVIYAEADNYDSVYKPIFNSHGLGFLIPGKKQMYIDGESLEELTYDHLLAIQAHEIAHYNLKHKGQYSEKQELEADVEGYKTLIDGNYTEAAIILKQRIEDHYGKKGLKALEESNIYSMENMLTLEGYTRYKDFKSSWGSPEDLMDDVKIVLNKILPKEGMIKDIEDQSTDVGIKFQVTLKTREVIHLYKTNEFRFDPYGYEYYLNKKKTTKDGIKSDLEKKHLDAVGVFNKYIGSYDPFSQYIDDGGQYKSAERNNDSLRKMFNELSKSEKKKAVKHINKIFRGKELEVMNQQFVA